MKVEFNKSGSSVEAIIGNYSTVWDSLESAFIHSYDTLAVALLKEGSTPETVHNDAHILLCEAWEAYREGNPVSPPPIKELKKHLEDPTQLAVDAAEEVLCMRGGQLYVVERSGELVPIKECQITLPWKRVSV